MSTEVIVFIGDSNPLFFWYGVSASDTGDGKELETYTRQMNMRRSLEGPKVEEGSGLVNYLVPTLFIWHSALTAYNATDEYLIKRIEDALPQDASIKAVLFQFGRCDIAGPLQKYNNASEVGFLLAKRAKVVGEYFNTRAILTYPLVVARWCPRNLSEEFNTSLGNGCSTEGLEDPIDIFDVVPKNFAWYPWDEYGHLTQPDSKKAMEHILKEAKLFPVLDSN